MESAGAFSDGDWESSLTKMFSTEDLEITPHFLGQCSFFPSNNVNVEGTSFSFGQSPSSMYQNMSDGGVMSTTHESLLFHSLDSLNSSLQYLSQESSCYSTSTNNSGSTGGVFTHGQENNYVNYNYSDSYDHNANQVTNNNVSNDLSMPMNFLMGEKNIINETPCHVPAFSDTLMGEGALIKEDNFGKEDDKSLQPETSVVSGKELQLKRVYDVVPKEKTNPEKKTRVAKDVSYDFG